MGVKIQNSKELITPSFLTEVVIKKRQTPMPKIKSGHGKFALNKFLRKISGTYYLQKYLHESAR